MKFEENTHTRQQTGVDTQGQRTSLSHMSSDQQTMEGTKQQGFYMKTKNDSREKAYIDKTVKNLPTSGNASSDMSPVIKNQTLQPVQANYQTIQGQSSQQYERVVEREHIKNKRTGSQELSKEQTAHFSEAGTTLLNESEKNTNQSVLQTSNEIQKEVSKTVEQSSRQKFKGIFPPKKGSNFQTIATSTPQNLLNMQKRIEQARRKKVAQVQPQQSQIPFFKKSQLDLEREKITNFFSKQQEEQEDYQSKLTPPPIQTSKLDNLRMKKARISHLQQQGKVPLRTKASNKQMVEVVVGQKPEDFSPNKDIQTDQIKPNDRFNFSKDQLEIQNPVSLFDGKEYRRIPITSESLQNDDQQQFNLADGPAWGLEIEKTTHTGGMLEAHSNTNNNERQSQGGFSQYRSSINSNPDTSDLTNSQQTQPQRIQIRQSREGAKSSQRRAFKNLLVGKRRQTPGYNRGEITPSKSSQQAARIQSVLVKQTPRLQNSILNSRGEGTRTLNHYDSLNSEENYNRSLNIHGDTGKFNQNSIGDRGSMLSSLETEAYERDFDECQTKIFMAIKMQQGEQSRQIVNDILIPSQHQSSEELQNIYKNKFTVHGKLSQLIQKHGRVSKQTRSNPRLAPLHINYGVDEQPQQQTTQHDCIACSTEQDFMSKKTSSVFDFRQQDRMEKLEADRKTVNDVLAHFSSSKATIKRALLEGDERSSSLANFRNTRQLLNDMSIDYQDFNTTNKQRLQAMKASACLKRKTQFQSVPRAQKSFNYQLKKHSQANAQSHHSSKRASQRTQTNGFGNQQNLRLTPIQDSDAPTWANRKNTQGQNLSQQSMNNQFKTNSRFEEFKAKIKKQQEEINYMSDSQKSTDSVQNQIIDYNRDNDLLALKKAFKQQKSGVVSLLEIIRKNAEKRSNDQRDHLVAHLMFRVPFFEDYSKELLGPTCEHLEGKEFKAGETLVEQDDIGDTMYIIFGGECGEYYFPHNYRGNFEQALNQQPNAILGANDVVGEKAVIDLHNDGVRQFTVVAHTDVVALELRKKDYQSVLYQYNLMERNRRFDFLAKLDFFKQMDRVSLIDFNSASEQIKIAQGDTLYDIGQMPNNFYVVREGKLIMETIIEVDTYFKFPINRHKWEVRKQTKVTCYKLQDLTKGACFGHEEILQGFNRRCRVRALTKATLVCTDHEEMTRTMPAEQIDYLKKTMRSLDLDQIVKKIERYKTERMKRNQAVLDATSINAHDFSGDRFSFNELQNQSKIDKLLPWLNKARQNTTENLNLIHELNKVKILSSKIERIFLEKGDEDVLLSEDLTTKTEARFVLPDPKDTSGDHKNSDSGKNKRNKVATLVQKKDSTTVMNTQGSRCGMSPLKFSNNQNLMDSKLGYHKLSHSRQSSIMQSRVREDPTPQINRQMTLIERMKRNEISSMEVSHEEDTRKVTNFRKNS